MFELSVACKYLLPRRRQLSVSIISIISVLVIALVVWLIVVFFSVTDGLEKSWIQKLTALTAPVRITPTEAYYQSYYYQVDSISDQSEYTHKTIREKNESAVTDPYDSEIDTEIPSFWPAPDYQRSGELKDLVKLVYQSIQDIPSVAGLKAQDFELTGSQIRLRLNRESSSGHGLYPISTQSYLSYPTYLGNFEPNHTSLAQTLLPIEIKDINNLFNLIDSSDDFSQEEDVHPKKPLPVTMLRERLMNFFQYVEILTLRTRSSGWPIPRTLIPSDVNWKVIAIFKDDHLLKVIIPLTINDSKQLHITFEENPDLTVLTGSMYFKGKQLLLDVSNQQPHLLLSKTPVVLAGGILIPAQLNVDSIQTAKQLANLSFNIELSIQGTPIQGAVPYRGLEIGKADIKTVSDSPIAPAWIHQINNTETASSLIILPKDSEIGDGLLLPKGFREAGALIGDRGYLTYVSPTTSILQEQRLPVYVAGFYDPGIIPIGGKFILANRELISIIRASHNQDDKATTNGINVHFKDFQDADKVKTQLQQAFKDKGISRYWNIETYREYEFTKEILRELQSQKNIFTLIAVVIIVVACSNIISMLIILVNDKKTEIGILRSMGASSKSIALIFGFAGAAIGILGSGIGILTAIVTIHQLPLLIGLISRIQGYDIFQAAFYGDMVPQELSYEALSFVMGATVAVSLLAGIVPAIKACLLKPSSILRSVG